MARKVTSRGSVGSSDGLKRGGRINTESNTQTKPKKTKKLVWGAIILVVVCVGAFFGYKFYFEDKYPGSPGELVDKYYNSAKEQGVDGIATVFPESKVVAEQKYINNANGKVFIDKILKSLSVEIPKGVSDKGKGTLLEDTKYKVKIPDYKAMLTKLESVYTDEKRKQVVTDNKIDLKSPAAPEDLVGVFLQAVVDLDEVPVKEYNEQDSVVFVANNETQGVKGKVVEESKGTEKDAQTSGNTTNDEDIKQQQLDLNTDASNLVEYIYSDEDKQYKITSDANLDEVLFSSESFYQVQVGFNKLFGVNQVFDGWIGAELLGEAGVEGVSGEGTLDNPYGYGFGVRTEVKTTDNKVVPVRVNMVKSFTHKEAIQYVERLDDRNRGFDVDSDQSVGVVLYKVTNLSTKDIKFKIPISLVNPNGNAVSRTGVVFGIADEVTLKPGETKNLSDWFLAPSIDSDLIAWGINLPAEKRIMFKLNVTGKANKEEKVKETTDGADEAKSEGSEK